MIRSHSLGLQHVKRHLFLTTLLAILLLSSKTVYSFTVVVVKSQDLAPYNRAVDGFRETISNRVVELNLKGDSGEDHEAIIKQIGHIRPDVILAVGVKAALLAKSKLIQYPIVYAMVISPEKYRLSGDNIYGIPLEVPPSEQFKVLKRIIPALEHIGVIYDPEISGGLVAKAIDQAKNLGLSLETLEVHSRKEVPNAVHHLKDKEIDAIWMVPDSTVYSEETLPFILTFAFDEGLPFLAFSESFVEAGALLSLSPDYEDVGRQASLKIDEILNGKVQNSSHPFKYRLVLNLKTAKKIHIVIPQPILDESSQVYH